MLVKTLHRIRRLLTRWLFKLRGFFWAHKLLFTFFWATWLSLPPLLLNHYMSLPTVGEWLRGNIPKLGVFIDKHPIELLALMALWVPASCLLRGLVTNLFKTEPAGWSSAPQVVLKTLDGIVGHKESRFHEHYQRVLKARDRGEAIDPGGIFRSITRPHAQLARIGEAVYTTFGYLTQRSGEAIADLKVNLALIQNKELVNFICHFPSNHRVRSSVSKLSHESSTIMTAFRTGKLVVISSVLTESLAHRPRFVVTSEARSGEDGSLLCYPIELTGHNLAVVVSIFHPEPGVFEQRYQEKYKAVLATFALRIRLEFALLGLIGVVENDEALNKPAS